MKPFRLEIVAAIACLTVSATSFANVADFFGGTWHVVQNRRTHVCYRVTDFSPTRGWRDLGTFNTFRTAGRFVWTQRGGACRSSPIFQ